ncbi:ImmA/IrrE family metallo-endopeptidase [Devosia riboflavina]
MPADFKMARRCAQEVIERIGKTRPPVDPEAVAELLGVQVVYADLGDDFAESVSGFIEMDALPPRIVVNNAIHPNRMTFTIAHELGHFLMHKEYATGENYRVMPRRNVYDGPKPPEEQEADAFAAELLVPLEDAASLRRYRKF